MNIYYTLERGTKYEEGSIKVLNASTGVYTETSQLNNGGSADYLGVQFDASIDVNDKILLSCQVDNSVNDVNMRYNINRVIIPVVI